MPRYHGLPADNRATRKHTGIQAQLLTASCAAHSQEPYTQGTGCQLQQSQQRSCRDLSWQQASHTSDGTSSCPEVPVISNTKPGGITPAPQDSGPCLQGLLRSRLSWSWQQVYKGLRNGPSTLDQPNLPCGPQTATLGAWTVWKHGTLLSSRWMGRAN